jgi:hypothetical protein
VFPTVRFPVVQFYLDQQRLMAFGIVHKAGARLVKRSDCIVFDSCHSIAKAELWVKVVCLTEFLSFLSVETWGQQ